MTQHFTGSLAGLSVLNGAVERDGVLKCMTTCAEKLDFHAMSEMKTGMVRENSIDIIGLFGDINCLTMCSLKNDFHERDEYRHHTKKSK